MRVACYYQKSKKRKTLKRKMTLFCAFLAGLIILILIFFNLFINPAVIQISVAKVNELSNKAVGTAIHNYLTHHVLQYSDFIEFKTDTDGNITAMIANTVLINKMARQISRSSQEGLEQIGAKGIHIPLGTFSGITIFSGRGPKINIKIVPIGSMGADFVSEFTSVGINQTLHKISIKATSSVTLVLPVRSKIITTTTYILVCESIIVGRVPEVYLNGDGKWNGILDVIS